MNAHEIYMHRCLLLAQNGLGNVAPNPLVGAVLVHNQTIIGEGWHRQYGAAHAEVNCIQSVKPELRHLIAESTLYVNLEPCNHTGKTPPCTLLVLEQQIKKVVVGSTDPNPLVAGSGIARLRQAGVEVIENILPQECAVLNRRFFTFHQKKRPFVIVKMAQSANGFMAPKGKQQQWLTNDISKQLSHRWRSEEAAILIGKNTALIDNPQLTTRLWKGRNPLRILVDKKNEVPDSSNIFSTDANTLVFNQTHSLQKEHIELQQIEFTQNVPEQILHQLFLRNIQSVIVEGGPATAHAFLQANVADEVRLITAPCLLANGIATPVFSGNLREQFYLQQDMIQVFNLS